MNGRDKRKKKAQRNRDNIKLDKRIPVRPCMNCGGRGPHFVPPSFGEPGFYTCKKQS